MNGTNLTILFGNAGGPVQMNEKGTVAKFSLATSENWTDDGGEKQSRTQWHTVKGFGALAKIMNEKVEKGTPVYVEGQLNYNDWTDTNGSKRHEAEVVARQFRASPKEP